MNEDNKEMIMTTAVTAASGVTTVLYLLRGSRVAQAVELLEQQLDAAVVSLNMLTSQVSPPDRKHIMDALRSIRDYRHQYQEKRDIDMHGIAENVMARLREVQEHARSILVDIG
jgi:CheY-like chemotaxis protein